MSDLGVKYPCYGEYYCSRCKRRWDSCVAWRDYGQQCKSCSAELKPSKLERLYPYCCTKPECGKQWKNRRVENSKCFGCGSPGKMFSAVRERQEYMTARNLKAVALVVGAGPSRQNHQKELCELCQVSVTGDCRTAQGRTIGVTIKKEGIIPIARPGPPPQQAPFKCEGSRPGATTAVGMRMCRLPPEPQERRHSSPGSNRNTCNIL